MTKTERADILLDAIGFIGEDIVAEASGMSSVLQIPSKLKLNLMVMRRLLVATLCLVLISTITPLSVYLYNNYIVPAVKPPETTADDTSLPETDTEAEGEFFDIPEGYGLDNYLSFEMLSHEDGDQKKVTAYAFTLSKKDDASRAVFLEIRNFDGTEITDRVLFRGHSIVIMHQPLMSELIIFNTALNDGSDVIGHADIAKYCIIDGKLTESDWIGIRHADFDLSSEDSVTASRMQVFNMFMTLSREIESSDGKLLILDTYTSDKDIIHHPDERISAPNITNDRKEGNRTWSIDRIGELFGFVPEEETIPEYYKTYETEDGWLIKGLTAAPEKYIVVGSTEKIAKETVVPTLFNGYPIVSIDNGALVNCQAETLTIPREIHEVNFQSFLNSKIKRLIIECGDDTKFDAECFVGAPFEEVIFTGDKSEIEYSMFYQCRSLKYVKLPDTLVKINRMAFQGCISLDNLVLPEGLTTIERNAFYYCSSLREITIPKTVEHLSEYAFYDCKSLASFTILSQIDSIPFAAFGGNACETIKIKEGIKVIDDAAIRGDNLKYLYLPSTLTSIVTYFLDSPTSSIEAVYFNGTLEEWSRVTTTITTGQGLNEYTIYCTDGEIHMNKID